MFSSPTMDSSSRRFYHNEDELLADSPTTKPLSEQEEAAADSPVHKMSQEKHEAPVHLDVSCRKIAKDKIFYHSLETSSFKISNQESHENVAPKKISRQRSDVSIDVALRKGVSHDFDIEVSLTKTEQDTAEDLMDIPSRQFYKERYDADLLEMKKILQPELETETHRDTSGDNMESSINVASAKKMKDDAKRLTESRRLTRNSMGMSQDTASRKLPLNMGDCQHESSLRALPKDQVNDTAIIPERKISRDEMEYCIDTSSIKMHPRETMDAFRDTSNLKNTSEFGLESTKSRGILRNEAEMSASSLRRRIPGLPRSDTSPSSTDTFIDNISWDRVNASVDMPKNITLRDDFGRFESSSLPSRTGQPDLMLTSQVPWQSSSDLCTTGPLSKLVYDGILEKSCSSMASVYTPLSASTPNLPQSRMLSELESPLPSPKVVCPSLASPHERGDEKNKDKDKSKKTLKLKNLFKKKNETASEKSPSGLQKL